MAFKNNFILKLIQGLVSGVNLIFLYKILPPAEFSFFATFGFILTGLGILDFGLGVKFVNANISMRDCISLRERTGAAKIFGLTQYIYLSLTITTVLTLFSIPVSKYLLLYFLANPNWQILTSISLTTFLFIIGNFVSKIYLSVNRLGRLVKIQVFSAAIQLTLSLCVFALNLGFYCYLYVLCVPSIIMLLDSRYLVSQYDTRLKINQSASQKIKMSFFMQMVQICQSLMTFIFSFLVVENLTNSEIAFSSLIQRGVTVLMVALGMNFLQSWISTNPINPIYDNLFLPFDKGKRNLKGGKSYYIACFVTLFCCLAFFASYFDFSLDRVIATVMWGFVVITQIAYWSQYYVFLGEEKYSILFISSLVAVLSALPTTIILKNIGVLFPPTLFIVAQIASYAVLVLSRKKSPL